MPCQNCTSYQLTFDREHAEKEREDYENTGLKKSTTPLVELLKQRDLKELSLLDIGGGIGAISFELINSGIQTALNVDISQAYLETFQRIAESKGLTNQTNHIEGDFLEHVDEISTHDIVTLDKVICCYPDYKSLVSLSLEKCRRYYAIIIPRDLWWVKAGEWLESWIRKFKGKPFKTYIHPVAGIEQLIQKAGFKVVGQRTQREWLISVFEKDT